jgi:outer membrane protein assembly factor BamD (BamD/ComL family)
LYEAGKQHRENGDWGNARESFEAANKTTALPVELQPRSAEKAAFCELMLGTYDLVARKTIEHEVLVLLRENKFDDSVSYFQRAKLPKHSAVCLYEAGKKHCENGDWGKAKQSFASASKTHSLPEELKIHIKKYQKECNQKTKHLKRLNETSDLCVSEREGEDRDERAALELFKQGKLAFTLGNVNEAKQLFEEAEYEYSLPEDFSDRAELYIKQLEALVVEAMRAKTAKVFSDNCTHLLGSCAVTLGLSTTTIGLSTKTTPTSRASRELVMVLDEKFPANSKARGNLIILLKTDVRKALEAVSNCANIDIMDLLVGSVIVHFRFVNDGNNSNTWLEEEYLKQVDDKKSKLYQGTVTCRIDQNRTQTMTMQLGSRLAQTPCPYHVGDTITLAQVDNDTIKCTVDSLLGEGATATVFKVTTNGKPRALKVFKAENSLAHCRQRAPT